ncbi:MAG: hypothetical protein R3D26_08070 [Cyanobacteriota/Melainabacteria group bacterium]
MSKALPERNTFKQRMSVTRRCHNLPGGVADPKVSQDASRNGVMSLPPENIGQLIVPADLTLTLLASLTV